MGAIRAARRQVGGGPLKSELSVAVAAEAVGERRRALDSRVAAREHKKALHEVKLETQEVEKQVREARAALMAADERADSEWWRDGGREASG